MLAKERRENLLSHVKEARRVIEDAFDRALNGLGLFKDRATGAERIDNPARLNQRRIVDQVLARDREVGGLGYAEARQRYVEHCAFTLVNRVAALRAMEVRGFLPKVVIAQDEQYGGLSPWARDLSEAGSVEILGESIAIETPDEARWQAIRAACEEVSKDVGMLFDLRDEYSALTPEPVAVKDLLRELTATVTEADWHADDILGWVYQYYNVPANAAYKERRKRRGYRMTADDMIVANQFYTPHWVVRVLVDNTLGRIWWESIPDLARRRCGATAAVSEIAVEDARLRQVCRATCAYLVPLPDEQRLGWWGEEARANAEARAVEEARKRHQEAGGKPAEAPQPPVAAVPARAWKAVRELKIIDPACGSAHFLLYVFDMLRRMYAVEPAADRPDPAKVPDLILSGNLHGVDVDLRACQLAAFNLYLKARQSYREITVRDEFHPSGMKIVCAGARVTDGENRRELLDSFADNFAVQELAKEILNDLSRTGEIGSLLQVRQKFEPLLRRQKRLRGEPVQGNLFGTAEYRPLHLFKDTVIEEYTLPQILERLSRFEAEARPSGDVGRQLFARELTKSCGLAALLSDQYDVALMNPPYGEMPDTCKDYCRGNRRQGITAHYPNTANNLYAAFMERCIDLVGDNCLTGSLTSQTFMNLSTFARTRTEVLNKLAPPEILCDTGFDVLDGAKVVTAATVLRRQGRPDHSRACPCFRMFQESESDKEAIVVEAITSMRSGFTHPRVYYSSVDVFSSLPGSVYAYWVPVGIAKLFETYPPLDRDFLGRSDLPKLTDVKSGITTGDDPRFVRYFWEIDRMKVGTNLTDTREGRFWCPFGKGGWLDAYQADVSCVVNWADDGREVRACFGARPQNEGFFFRQGLSWHRAPQYPSNQLRVNARVQPEHTIPAIPINCIFPKTKPMWELLGYLNSELIFFLVRVFEIRLLLAGPVASLPYPEDRNLEQIGQYARSAYHLRLSLRSTDECSPYFVLPALLLALQPIDQLGKPQGHPHAAEFRWPIGEAAEGEIPDAVRLFRAVYANYGFSEMALRQLAAIGRKRLVGMRQGIATLQQEIDAAVYGVFQTSLTDQQQIAREIAFRQCQPVLEEGEDPAEEPEGTAIDHASDSSLEDESLFVADQITKLLSYAVKLVLERDSDGLIPIVQTETRLTLADRVKSHFGEWFGAAQIEPKWAEAGEILGKPVERWLAEDYFDFHTDMYRRRPIFWQLTSAYCVQRGSLPGAFSCLVHYHKLQGNTLQNIRAHYVAPALQRAQAQYDAARGAYETQQRSAANRTTLNRAKRALDDADRNLQELVEFDRRLQHLDTGARPVTPPPGADDPWLKQKIAEVTGGPQYGRGWLPVIDYGVRVNIEPLKVARILPRAADRIN
ncbi:MAG TPA: hypothetical protein VEL76_16730 [Gemmataceae bacterium]|nr:hypothetical protein [Gemmataceae bacterium]